MTCSLNSTTIQASKPPTPSSSITTAATAPVYPLNRFDMEATDFGIAIIAEARALVSSITTRVANIRNGPGTFRILMDNLNRLMRHLSRVEALLQTTHGAIPEEVAANFSETLESVRDALSHSSSAVEKICAKAFPESGSGRRSKLKAMFHRKFRAKAINRILNGLQPPLQDASSQLLTLSSMMASRLNSQELQDVLAPKLDNLQITGNVEEVYREEASTPALPQGTTVSLGTKVGTGKHFTAEGMLKESILSSESSSTLTVAEGTLTPTHAAVGMTVDGKTTALQGLAFDEDIRVRFPDGIQHIAFRQGAASTTAIAETCSSQSRMAISTRSTLIAHSARRRIESGARDPLGAVSENIFMMHTTRDGTWKAPQEPDGKRRRSVSTILRICAGLPLALAVTGCAVAFLAEKFGDDESACDDYASRLEKLRRELGEEQAEGSTSLNAAICLSTLR